MRADRHPSHLWSSFSSVRIHSATVVVVGAVVFFIVTKIINSAPRFSDGNFYIYIAYLITQGSFPYRDFFYSSPPFIPYFFALIGSLIGFSWQSFNLVPVGLTIIDVWVIYRLAAGAFSRLVALLTTVLYLFSFVVLHTTDFVSDIHLVVSLSLLATFSSLKRWPLLGGVLFGLAALTKVYAVVLFIPLLAFLFLTKQAALARRLVAGFTLIFGVVTIFFWWWQGDLYLHNVFLSHIGEVAVFSKKYIFQMFLRHDIVLAAGLPLLGLLQFWWYRQSTPSVGARAKSLLLISMLILGSITTFLLLYKDIYFLYLKMAAPWLAFSWGATLELLRARLTPRIFRGVTAVLLGMLMITFSWYYLHFAEQGVIAHLEDITAYVAQVTEQAEPIYGEFYVTPLIALETGRPIFKNYVETAYKFFQFGIFDIPTRTSELIAGHVKTIITFGGLNPHNPQQLQLHQSSLLDANFYATYCRLGKIFPFNPYDRDSLVVIWRCHPS
ncbi:MAG: glycosyltransferase family 39 protein [Candidatus Andersenbacteria bacterium]